VATSLAHGDGAPADDSLLRVRGPAQVTVRFRQAGGLAATLEGRSFAVLVGSDDRWDVFVMHGESPEQVDRWLSRIASHAGASPQVLARAVRSATVRSRHRPDGAERAAADADATRLAPTTYRDGREVLSFLVPGRDSLRDLLDRLRKIGVVELVEVEDVDTEALSVQLPASEITRNLTPRQLDVLLRAVGDGYYETPRRTNAEDQASHHGVARATWEEHLRKGEDRVLRALAGMLTRHPFLDRIAQRRVGRPPARSRPEE
jgi:predicted DNA binding protein